MKAKPKLMQFRFVGIKSMETPTEKISYAYTTLSALCAWAAKTGDPNISKFVVDKQAVQGLFCWYCKFEESCLTGTLDLQCNLNKSKIALLKLSCSSAVSLRNEGLITDMDIAESLLDTKDFEDNRLNSTIIMLPMDSVLLFLEKELKVVNVYRSTTIRIFVEDPFQYSFISMVQRNTFYEYAQLSCQKKKQSNKVSTTVSKSRPKSGTYRATWDLALGTLTVHFDQLLEEENSCSH